MVGQNLGCSEAPVSRFSMVRFVHDIVKNRFVPVARPSPIVLNRSEMMLIGIWECIQPKFILSARISRGDTSLLVQLA